MPMLDSPVIGIPISKGYGCPDCLFVQERARNIPVHLLKEHGCRDSVDPVFCSIQRLFVSNLHGWWRVNAEPRVEETTDEGLIALRQFSAEFDRLEQENGHSAVGIKSCLSSIDEQSWSPGTSVLDLHGCGNAIGMSCWKGWNGRLSKP
jgi:hypothetical protein